MTSIAEPRPDKFRIERVFSDSLSVMVCNPVPVIALASLFSALPALALNLWNYRSLSGTRMGEFEAALSDSSGITDNAWISAALSLIYLILALLFQSALVRAAIEDLNGKRPAIGDCVRVALRSLLPTVGISAVIILALAFAVIAILVAGQVVPIYGMFIALVALLVPGIIWFLGVFVSIPVLIQERRGVLGSMSRSRALIKGSRWQIFGVLVILMVAAFVIQTVFGIALAMAIAFAGGISTVGLIVGVVGSSVVSTVVSTLVSITIAVSYVELRQVKEGAGVDELAEVFA